MTDLNLTDSITLETKQCVAIGSFLHHYTVQPVRRQEAIDHSTAGAIDPGP
jgi:hypothetical protein